MPRPWFTAREDGLGWRPAGFKGWAAVCAAGLLLVGNFVRLALSSRSVEQAFGIFLPEALATLLAYFWFCLLTGETLPALRGRVWFKAKRIGWGWTPATPEGWIVVGVFLAGLAGSTIALIHFRPAPPTPAMLAEHLILALVLFASLIGICWKTGE